MLGWLAATAIASAQDFDWSARLTDSQGVPLTGTHAVTLTLRDAGQVELWRKTWSNVPFDDGFVALTLTGVDNSARALAARWALDPVYVSVALDGGADLSPAQALTSAPRASAVVGAVRLTDAPAACGVGAAGALRYTAGHVEVCDGAAWKALAADASTLGTATNPATSCKALKAAQPYAPSGSYFVDPDGAATAVSAYSTWCDLSGTTGWTRILNMSGHAQITGTGRNNFWWSGGNLDPAWAYSTFTSLEGSQEGFVGWSRLSSYFGQTVKLRVKGTNTLGGVVDEVYELQGFTVSNANTVLESGNLTGGGVWSISMVGDTNTRNGWGTCGTLTANNVHVGLGLCVNGYDLAEPAGREAQIWHYGDWSACVNTSFGNVTTATNWTLQCATGTGASVEVYFQE
jgi:hypothetical protein